MGRTPAVIQERLRRVKLVISDVDGTLARRIYLDSLGRDIKVFCEKDGLRIISVVRLGIPFVMISGRDNLAVRTRAKELKVEFFPKNKFSASKDPLEFFEKKYGVDRSEILYIGDDWSDLWWMSQVGISGAPADAEEHCRLIADIVAKASGGEGAVSEMLIRLLKAKRIYQSVVQSYLAEPFLKKN